MPEASDNGSQQERNDASGIGLEQFAKKMPKDGCKEDADRHQTRVASHTETPLGVSKWLGKRHHTRNLAFR